MASYHLSVKSVSRSAGRSAVAAAAYRSAERIECQREGRTHDYTRKGGVEHTEIVAPEGAPGWVRDRAALWNGAEAAENRKNSVVAREWELALPAELDDTQRRELAMDFAHELVERYGVAADVAIHAPHREGDQRNHHAHILTTTRVVGEAGFGAKTRILDVKQTSSIEVAAMRESWAERQNAALERVGTVERVDHRTLDEQRVTVEAERDRLEKELEERRLEAESEARQQAHPARRKMQALLDDAGVARKDDGETVQDRDWQEIERQLAKKTLEAVALDRPAEIKLGPKASAQERRAARMAEAQGKPYEPVTNIGALVHELREQRSLFEAAIERLERAGGNLVRHLRETVSWVRDAVLGSKEQVRDPEPTSDAQGRDAGRDAAAEAGPVAPSVASERRQALLDRLRSIGRGGESGDRQEQSAPDRGVSTDRPSPAEKVQKHIHQIEERSRDQAKEKMLRETRDRESRRRDRDDDRGMDR